MDAPLTELVLNPEGTLIDPLPCLADSVRYAVAMVGGRPPGRRDTEDCLGFPPIRTLARLLGCSPDQDRVKEAALFCAEYYLEQVEHTACLYPGALAALERFRERGGRAVAVIDQDWVGRTAARLGLDLDLEIRIEGGGCPLVRQARILELLRNGSLGQDACWMTDWPMELRLASELGVTGLLVGYGRFRICPHEQCVLRSPADLNRSNSSSRAPGGMRRPLLLH